MKEFVTIGYSYNELSDGAKEKVKEWYLNDELRNNLFYEDLIEYLKENFPRSELKVQYSLSYAQGDGLNIYGRLNMYDFLKIWDACNEVKLLMEKVLDNTDHWYNFAENRQYCYSCKFRDLSFLEDDVGDTIRDLENTELNIVDSTEIVRVFYKALILHFTTLDKKFEKDGYKYFYECEDSEVQEHCESNDYYFTESGEFIE